MGYFLLFRPIFVRVQIFFKLICVLNIFYGCDYATANSISRKKCLVHRLLVISCFEIYFAICFKLNERKKLFIVINKAKTTPILPNSKLMRAFKEIADVLIKLFSWSSCVL